MQLDGKTPSGPLQNKWDKYRFETKLVNPANKRKYSVIVVGTGLAGASASASLAEVSNAIIDQCVAQGVPFAREYGGMLANRSFGGAQVSRTFYARGQTGQQLLIGAYHSLSRQIGLGQVKMYNRHEMLDVVLIDGVAKGIITRNMVTGKIDRWAAD